MISYHQTLFGTMGATTWTPVVTCFRAPADEMEKRIRTFWIIHDSRKDNPRWTEDYIRLCATVARDQITRKQAMLQSMRKISRTQSEVSDMIADSYEKRNAAHDRIFDSYSEAIRGVDSYTDPINGWEVELPTGHDNAWTNGIEYIFSPETGFDPNIGSNQEWTRMNRTRR